MTLKATTNDSVITDNADAIKRNDPDGYFIPFGRDWHEDSEFTVIETVEELSLTVWTSGNDDQPSVQICVFSGDDNNRIDLVTLLNESFSTSEGAGPEQEKESLEKLRDAIDTLIMARENEICG